MGGTALHYAASGGHLEAAQLLIDCGVHINALVETTDEVCTTVHVLWCGGGGGGQKLGGSKSTTTM